MKEVEAKLAKLEELGDSSRRKWVEEHEVPCVVGPGKNLYMIDHHHAVAACYHAGVAKASYRIEVDVHTLSGDQFWQFMRRQEWLYLFDQFGKGPQEPGRLPLDIRSLADDPYRSLAWELRRAGVIAKVQKPFAEFEWAQWLRQHLTIDLHHESWSVAVAKALELGRQRVARRR